jgi:rhamnosyltransferase
MRASVVIITKNQRAYLERSLPMIAGQRGVPGGVEVIVADSGSTDGAQDVVRAHGAQLVEIAPASFSYARAHNAGAGRAAGEFVVRLSGDAVPAHGGWLRRLLRPFRDPAVAAAWGIQILPPHVKNPVERLGQWLFYDNARRPRRHTRDTTVLGCNMAVRRALWVAHPYDERLPQAEDYAWTHHWYRRGYAGVFVPAAPVVHGHQEPLSWAFKRALTQSALQGLIRVGVWGH